MIPALEFTLAHGHVPSSLGIVRPHHHSESSMDMRPRRQHRDTYSIYNPAPTGSSCLLQRTRSHVCSDKGEALFSLRLSAYPRYDTEDEFSLGDMGERLPNRWLHFFLFNRWSHAT